MGLPAASPASPNDAYMSTVVSPFAKSARTAAQRRATASCQSGLRRRGSSCMPRGAGTGAIRGHPPTLLVPVPHGL